MDTVALELDCVSLDLRSSRSTIKKAIINLASRNTILEEQKGGRTRILKSISCTIHKKERVALIGHNGSGKTSFLRLISGIYTPSEGSIKSYVSVYPMINRGLMTGPELTGYDAIKAQYLIQNKSIGGFDQYLSEIKTFSELGEYIYMPTKSYSQGMHARLLFAILTSGTYECLAIDEGFGHGDIRFFSKAQERLKEFVDNSGTMFLASHSEPLIRQFCERALVFSNGSIVFDGHVDEALPFYYEEILSDN